MRCSGAGNGSYRGGPQVTMACLGLQACLGSPLASVPPSPLPGAERSIVLNLSRPQNASTRLGRALSAACILGLTGWEDDNSQCTIHTHTHAAS
jgi:hypothetical protein